MADGKDFCQKYVLPDINIKRKCFSLCRVLLLIGELLFLLWLLFAAAWGAQWLDHRTGGDPIQLDLDLDDFLNFFDLQLNLSLWNRSSHNLDRVSARLQNRSAMSAECAAVIPLDAVSNISVAENCTEWCHEALGPNSATPYMASPFHMAMILHSDESSVYMTCFKTQTSWWALQVMPEWYYVYLVALVYGVWSMMAFCWTFWRTARHTVPGGPAEDHVSADGPFANGQMVLLRMCLMPFRCLCYIPVSTDREGSEMDLWFAALSLWFEPFLDIVSILTVLRLGQPFVAWFITIGVALPSLVARDPLQLGGARAMALSLRQGFATRELVEHRSKECWEALICTTVQCYTLITLHVEAMHLTAVLNLAVSAGLSVVLSIPSGFQAIHIRKELKDREWSHQNLHEAKRTMPLWAKGLAMGCCPYLGLMAAEMLERHDPIHLRLLWDIFRDPDSSWDQWLCSFVLGSCRLFSGFVAPLLCIWAGLFVITFVYSRIQAEFQADLQAICRTPAPETDAQRLLEVDVNHEDEELARTARVPASSCSAR